MIGGMQAQVADLFSKYQGPVELVLTLLFSTIIVFPEQVPLAMRRQADSFLGRSFFIVFTVFIATVFGWPLGTLAALLSALLIGAGSIFPESIQRPSVEGFSSEIDVRLVPDGRRRWFVEEVLGENPLIIEEDTVKTIAVQDLSTRYGGSVQSNTVTR